jgi:cytochrome oxidase assembly protein ShyY1
LAPVMFGGSALLIVNRGFDPESDRSESQNGSSHEKEP